MSSKGFKPIVSGKSKGIENLVASYPKQRPKNIHDPKHFFLPGEDLKTFSDKIERDHDKP